jgi:peptide/nickel transport system permease protein
MFVIPAAILGMLLCGSIMRMTRTMMLEVLRQDYVRTAWAKGLRERAVVVRHALRNALIPVITMLGMQLPILIGGSVIMEQIFVLPGMGRLMLNALSQRDYPVVSGINLLVASIVVGLNLVIDLSYSWFDPRLRYR